MDSIEDKGKGKVKSMIQLLAAISGLFTFISQVICMIVDEVPWPIPRDNI